MKNHFLKLLYPVIMLAVLSLPAISMALELQYPSFGGFNMQEIAANPAENLNKLIGWFYYFIVAVAGLSAFVMLVWGGVQWLTSAGNPTKINEAKERITSALLGLLIILGSWLILQIINPDLTVLNQPIVH